MGSQNSAQENFRLDEIGNQNDEARRDAMYGFSGKPDDGLGFRAVGGSGMRYGGRQANGVSNTIGLYGQSDLMSDMDADMVANLRADLGLPSPVSNVSWQLAAADQKGRSIGGYGPGTPTLLSPMSTDEFRKWEIGTMNDAARAADAARQASWDRIRQGAWDLRTTTPSSVSPGYKAASAAVGMVSDGLGMLAGVAITSTGVGLTAVPEPTTLSKWAGVPLIAYGATYTTKSAVGFGLNATNFISAIRGLTEEESYLPGSLLELGVRAAGGTSDQERLAAATDMAWGLTNGKLLDARLATGVITNPRLAALLQPATLTTVSREATLASPQAWRAWTTLDPKAGVVDWFFKINDNIIQPEFIAPKK